MITNPLLANRCIASYVAHVESPMTAIGNHNTGLTNNTNSWVFAGKGLNDEQSAIFVEQQKRD